MKDEEDKIGGQGTAARTRPTRTLEQGVRSGALDFGRYNYTDNGSALGIQEAIDIINTAYPGLDIGPSSAQRAIASQRGGSRVKVNQYRPSERFNLNASPSRKPASFVNAKDVARAESLGSMLSSYKDSVRGSMKMQADRMQERLYRAGVTPDALREAREMGLASRDAPVRGQEPWEDYAYRLASQGLQDEARAASERYAAGMRNEEAARAAASHAQSMSEQDLLNRLRVTAEGRAAAQEGRAAAEERRRGQAFGWERQDRAAAEPLNALSRAQRIGDIAALERFRVGWASDPTAALSAYASRDPSVAASLLGDAQARSDRAQADAFDQQADAMKGVQSQYSDVAKIFGSLADDYAGMGELGDEDRGVLQSALTALIPNLSLLPGFDALGIDMDRLSGLVATDPVAATRVIQMLLATASPGTLMQGQAQARAEEDSAAQARAYLGLMDD